jgi:hypothetical protein
MLKQAFAEFDRRVRPLMKAGDDMHCQLAGNSVSVSIWVGELATNEECSTQREQGERRIRAAEKLWMWFRTNRTEVEHIYLSLVTGHAHSE